uniref:Histone H2A/H2B/H3 domain-containing protein n=1 Tax=Panagrolaimus sp. PS1159 TaxID=55785 RepID=A0AC35G8D3_9BILA
MVRTPTTSSSKAIKKKKSKGKKTKENSFKIYIHRVLKQVSPDISISSMAMSCMDSFVKDIFERIAFEASRIAKYNGKQTLSAKEFQTASRLVLHGDIAYHAVSEGNKAITRFNDDNE